MRTLGLDVGDRRIGVAISDPEGWLAVPLRVIDQKTEDARSVLINLVRAEEVGQIVIGLPISMSGERGAQAERAAEFATLLSTALDLPIALLDERLTSVEADRRMQEAGMRGRAMKANRDAVAAAIILQSFLDSRKAPPLPPVE